jgi:hypothetical protein
MFAKRDTFGEEMQKLVESPEIGLGVECTCLDDRDSKGNTSCTVDQ